MTHPMPDPVIETQKAIAGALDAAWGLPVGTISEDSVYRYSRRALDPLPVEGPRGRSWIKASVLRAWAERNRTKASAGAAPAA